MKLSMWMIANQLMSLDCKLEIKDNAPAILNSARLVYATNCVHIYEENDYVVCNGEGDLIKIYDLELKRVFELVQSIFDTYEDWSDAINQYIRQKKYQKVVEEAHKIFKNPILLLDANSKVLGMTRQYGMNSLDDEWAYLYQYGFSSMNAINYMTYTNISSKLLSHGQQHFEFKNSPYLHYSGISNCMYFNDICCGRINVLAKERPLNPGDSQLLQFISNLLEPALGQLFFENFMSNSGSVFLNILSGKPYEQETLERQLSYLKWHTTDIYQLALIKLDSSVETQNVHAQLNMLFHMISTNLPRAIIMQQQQYIIVLLNYKVPEQPQTLSFFTSLTKNNPVQIGLSLPLENIINGAHLYKQAEYAILTGTKLDPEQAFFSFWNYAVDYMLLSGASIEEKVYACMPTLVAIWKLKREKEDVMFDTLKCFLACERSISQTASKMFLHKNTTSYRIKKAQEFLKWDLDNPDIRRYCTISIWILELYERHCLK